MTDTITTQARNLPVSDLVETLKTLDKRRVDIVVTPDQIRANNGTLNVEGDGVSLTDTGVSLLQGQYIPTIDFDRQLADRLGIPRTYLLKLRDERPDLYDSNVNGWLHGNNEQNIDGHKRRLYLRTWEPTEDGGPRIARAVFSDAYRRIDHTDVLMATLSGINESGASVIMRGADLSDRRLVARFTSPDITQTAQELLDGYRDPRSYNPAKDNPVVSAGFRVVNSETGFGAATITPEITVQVCGNGMTLTHLADRSIHVGKRQKTTGVVELSSDALKAELDLIKLSVRDTVRTILNKTWLAEQITDLTARANKPVTDPGHVIERVGQQLGFSDTDSEGILADFISGGQLTAGGVMNAITSYSQTVDNTDTAWALETKAVEAMKYV